MFGLTGKPGPLEGLRYIVIYAVSWVVTRFFWKNDA